MGTGGMRYGAGRPGYRAKAEQLQRVDIRIWRQRGYLWAGRSFSWHWNRGGDPAGSIGVKVGDGGDSLRLEYTVGDADERRDGTQTIRLTRTPCHFGNSRPWFVCPCCSRRAGLLYLRWGRFACRRCQKVAYTVQSYDQLDALWHKAAKLEARLGEHWQRPKGMRRHTYELILTELEDCAERREMAFAEAVERMFGSNPP
jgi:hypothetical protein